MIIALQVLSDDAFQMAAQAQQPFALAPRHLVHPLPDSLDGGQDTARQSIDHRGAERLHDVDKECSG